MLLQVNMAKLRLLLIKSHVKIFINDSYRTGNYINTIGFFLGKNNTSMLVSQSKRIFVK